jgi:hypothetical protein
MATDKSELTLLWRCGAQVLKDGDDFDPQDPGSDAEEGEDEDSSLYERVLLDLTEANGEPADISRRLTVRAPPVRDVIAQKRHAVM